MFFYDRTCLQNYLNKNKPMTYFIKTESKPAISVIGPFTQSWDDFDLNWMI